MVAVTLGIVVGVVVLVGFVIWKYSQRNRNYWGKRGVTQINKNLNLLRILFQLATKKKNVYDFDLASYNELGSKEYGGSVDLGVPSLLIKDVEMIKHVLVKDFDHFVDRREMKFHSEPMLALMLSALEGQEWKNVRSVMSPTFTTGKIRRMFEHFNKCSNQLVEFIKTKPVGSPGKRDIVVKEAFNRYLVDVIGAIAFGMETNCLKDPNSVFYQMAKRSSEFSFIQFAKVLLVMFAPFLTRFGLRVGDSVPMDFFENICKTALKNRESSKEKREDFLQLMIEARRGELKTDHSELNDFERNALLDKSGEQLQGKGKVILTDDMIAAQSMLFFIVGLDTTGSLLSFAVYFLAIHQDIQSKLYQEISKVMKEKDGKMDYDSIVHMEYMDKIIAEILRMYPPVGRIERRCTKDYKLPGTNVTVEKDSIVFMAIHAMHHDPQYYPDPENFDPERFSAEEKAKRNPYTYMPFGQGPRNCLGMRFALMEAKIALAHLVHNFSIEPCESTPVPIKLDNMAGRPVVDLELRFKTREA